VSVSVSVSLCERERERNGYLFGLKFSRFDLTHKNVALRLKRNLRVRLSYIIHGHVRVVQHSTACGGQRAACLCLLSFSIVNAT